jgi:DNA-binding transcriptional regulator YdaS (Cro superfamily)
MAERRISPSSIELERVTREIGAGALARVSGVHRTQIWRYSTGRDKPGTEQAARLQRATGGRVSADGWETIRIEGAA